MNNSRISLSIDKAFTVHLAIIAGLGSLHLIANAVYILATPKRLTGLIALFNMVEERSLANFISATALLAAALVSTLAALSCRNGSRALRRGWWASSVILLFLAIDEGAGIHDLLSGAGQRAMDSHGLFFIGWVAPYMVLAVATGMILLPFIWKLPRATMSRLMAAGIVYIGSAMGMEMLEGLLMEQSVNGAALSAVNMEVINHTVIMVVLVSIEEVGEMFGVALALRALLMHIVSYCPNWSFSIVNSAASSEAASRRHDDSALAL